MREITGDLWVWHDGGAVVAITTNGMVSGKGRAQMPRGCARQAAERFPDLPVRLGSLIASGGNHVHYIGNRLVSFPVEESPYDNPDPAIIRRSALELVQVASLLGWEEVILPRPGCGTGGLSWKEVRPLIEPILDDRFLIVTQQ